MLTAFLTILFILLFYGFYKINKLPLTTLIPVWLFIIFFSGLVFNAIITNLEMIEKPNSADPYISYLLLQYGFLPLAIFFLINMFNKLGPLLKAGTVILGALILMAAEFIFSLADIFQYIRWNPGCSALLWASLIIIFLVFYRFVESDFIKGNRHEAEKKDGYDA